MNLILWGPTRELRKKEPKVKGGYCRAHSSISPNRTPQFFPMSHGQNSLIQALLKPRIGSFDHGPHTTLIWPSILRLKDPVKYPFLRL